MERMITEIYKNIFRKEGLVNFDMFIRDYDTFEEIPLISRYRHLAFLNGKIEKKDTQFFLLNAAVFLLNNIDLYAKHRLSPSEYREFFVCLTFSDLDEIDTLGYAIPNFFVTRKMELLKFLRITDPDSAKDTDTLRSAFDRCGLSTFTLTRTVSQDQLCGDLVRIYAIDRANRLRLP